MTPLLSPSEERPLVAHVIHRLAVGGMENGLVNLINHMSPDHYRHAIICLADSTEFKFRIESNDVAVIELNKAPGQDLGVHARLWKVLRQLRPDIVHTRNLAAIECQLTAALAGVRGRVHGEHGRDIYDLDGKNRKYNALRKAMRPFVRHYTAVSRDLENWLIHSIGIRPQRVTQIYNGVAADRFHPRSGPRPMIGPANFIEGDTFVIGTVGRMEMVKDQLTLVRAFIHLMNISDHARQHLRLVIIGDGSLRQPALDLLRSAKLETSVWLPGERDDVPELMRAMDLFVLPSVREGICNTILEAMASGLPVVATDVGGNPELVDEGITGSLTPASDPIAMAKAIESYIYNEQRVLEHGRSGRLKIQSQFTMRAMVAGYLNVYDSLSRKPLTASMKAGAISRST
ncbi:MAG TPA: TIGR03088 family PEP-CTERM/XrtA system glycosyltransferase [Candidatus Binatia bacterium]|jgi:sugar transferase (PEP-CTERM/EpsH1 system associated)